MPESNVQHDHADDLELRKNTRIPCRFDPSCTPPLPDPCELLPSPCPPYPPYPWY